MWCFFLHQSVTFSTHWIISQSSMMLRIRTSKSEASEGVLTLGREWILSPSEGVQVPRGLVHEWGENGAGGWPENQGSGGGVAFALSHKESFAFRLNLPINQFCSYPHLRSWTLGHDRKNYLASVRRRNGFPLEDGWLLPEELGVELLLLCVERNQLRWFGHLVRMPPGLQARPAGRRHRERPRTRWRGYTSLLAWECLGVPQSELVTVAREGDPLLELLPLRPD